MSNHWWDDHITVEDCLGESCEKIMYVAWDESGQKLMSSEHRSACIDALKHLAICIEKTG